MHSVETDASARVLPLLNNLRHLRFIHSYLIACVPLLFYTWVHDFLRFMQDNFVSGVLGPGTCFDGMVWSAAKSILRDAVGRHRRGRNFLDLRKQK